MKSLVGILSLLFIMIACSDNGNMDKYDHLVKEELATKNRVDSIFLGIYFGMTRKNFFAHCWNMNKKGIFTDGNDGLGNMFVLYKIKHDLKHPASLNFYPDFKDSTIWKMQANIRYDGWAPWNKYLYADSLLPDVLKMYKAWYPTGNDFIPISDKEKGTIYVKVDGNRRITIGKRNDMMVNIDYTDLLAEKEIKRQ